MKTKGKSIIKKNIAILFLVLIVLVTFFSFATDYFFSVRNFTAILSQTAINGILAIGVTFCLITAGIDLSVGSMLSLCGVTLAITLRGGAPVVVAVLIALIVGAFGGMVNGLLISKGNLPPFIATLGMQSIAGGVALIITEGRPITGVAGGISVLGSGKIGVVPISFLIMILCFFIAWLILENTKMGRYFYTIGGNIETARLSGINVALYRTLPFVLSGILAGIAAVVLTGRLGSAEPIAGSGTELDAVAASIIGGTSMTGGEGTIVGVLIGTLIMSVISNGMVQMNVGTYPQRVVIGMILISVVLIDMYNREKK